MAAYRCYFFGTNGGMQQRVEYEAESDEFAIIEARALYAESRFKAGFEVWQELRVVCCENTSRLGEELRSPLETHIRQQATSRPLKVARK